MKVGGCALGRGEDLHERSTQQQVHVGKKAAVSPANTTLKCPPVESVTSPVTGAELVHSASPRLRGAERGIMSNANKRDTTQDFPHQGVFKVSVLKQ